MSAYHRGLAQVMEIQRGLVMVVDCQTTRSSWLAHMEWADDWGSITGEWYGCGTCGATTFHAANIAHAEAINDAIYAASRAVWATVR